MNDVDGKFFRGEPFIPRRGVMIDLARVVETPEFVISQLPFYASSHLNCLYLHFENKLRYPSSPDWAHPCAWEMADLRRVIAAAAEWKIECIPVIASVGHQESLLIHPRYRKFAAPGTMDHLNVSDPEAVRFFEMLLDDLCAVCPAKVFHLGGDEAPYLPGGPEEYRRFFNRMARHLAASGRRIMIWADMMLKHPEIRDGLDRSIMPVVWNYGPIAADYNQPEQLHSEGFDVAIAPAILADEPFLTTPERLLKNLPCLPRRAFSPAAAIGCLWEPRTQFLDSVKIGVSIFARSTWNPNAPQPSDPIAAAAERIYADAALSEVYRLIHGGELFDLMLSSRMRYYHAFEFCRSNPLRRRAPEIIAALHALRERADAGIALLRQNRTFRRNHPDDFRLWMAQGALLRLLAALPGEPGILTGTDFDFVLAEYRTLWNERRNPGDLNFKLWFGDVLPFLKTAYLRGRPPRRMLRLLCNKGDAAEWNLLRVKIRFDGELIFFKTIPLWMSDEVPVDIAPLDDLPEQIHLEVIYATCPPRSGNWQEMVDAFAVTLDENGAENEILPLSARSTPDGLEWKI